MWGIICVLPLLLIIMSLSCPIEAAVEVYLPEVSSGPVGTVLIPVNITSVAGLESWNLAIEFNPEVLEPNGPVIVETDLTEFYTVEFNYPVDSEPPVPDKKRLNVAGILDDPEGPEPTGEGVLFYIQFEVLDAPATTDIDIVIEPDAGAPEITAGPKGVFYAETVHYSLYPITGAYRINPERSFTIPVKINDVEDLQAWNLTVDYPDNIVEFTEMTTTTLTQGYHEDPNGFLEVYVDETAGSVQVAGILKHAPTGGTGTFLYFKFKGISKGSGNIVFSAPSDQGNQFGPVDEFKVSVKVVEPYTVKRVTYTPPPVFFYFQGPQQAQFFNQYFNAYLFQIPRFFAPPTYPFRYPSGIFPSYAYPSVQYGTFLTRFPTTLLYGRYFPVGQFFRY